MLGSILGGGSGCIVTPESHFKQTIPLSLSTQWTKGISRDEVIRALKRNFRFKIWGAPLPSYETFPDVLMPHEYGDFIISLVNEYANFQGIESWATWIDHTPQNIQHPLMLKQIFANAKFIHLVRDPRAITASILPLDWGPDTAEEAALFWAQKLSYGLALEQQFPAQCLRVYYEDIVRSPEETIRKVCEHCDIAFAPDMLDGSAFVVPDYTRGQHQLVGSRPDAAKLDSWKYKLDGWQVAAIEKSVGDLMQLMGYELTYPVRLGTQSWRKRFAKRFAPLISYFKKRRFQKNKRRYE